MIFTLLDIAHDLLAQLYATGCEHIGYNEGLQVAKGVLRIHIPSTTQIGEWDYLSSQTNEYRLQTLFNEHTS